MTRVFAVHQPTGRDRVTGRVVDTMDLSPAEQFGPLRFVLRDWENPFRDFAATAAEVRRAMTEQDFGPEDWLLLVGNPCLIGLVAAEAARITGGLRLLQWDRTSSSYLPVSTQLGAVDLSPAAA